MDTQQDMIKDIQQQNQAIMDISEKMKLPWTPHRK